jgi:GntR family transcriptional regulator
MNTVIRSLERLQFEGLVEAEHGVGYFVKMAHSINREVMNTISDTVKELKKNAIDLQMAKVLLEEVWKND